MELDATSTNMHITPMGKLICYTSADTGKEIDINSENKSMFSEYFKKIIKEPMKTEAEDMLTAKEIVAEEGPQYEEKPLDIAEVMPSFPGGDAAMMQWLSVNITYPPIAEENGVQGRVIVRFYVGKDGAIYNPKVLRSVDPSLDKEALRVVKSMPRWIPGKQKGEPVAVYFTLPVTFQLQ
ncbi:MAG: energy transducer TonB [Prevotella sp.]